MKRKHERTLELIFHRPISGNIQWKDIEALFIELGAAISAREGSRILVRLLVNGEFSTALTHLQTRTRVQSRVSASG